MKIKLKRMHDFLTFKKSNTNFEKNQFDENYDYKLGKNKKKIYNFFKSLGPVNECLIERISKNDPIIIDKTKIEFLKVLFELY